MEAFAKVCDMDGQLFKVVETNFVDEAFAGATTNVEDPLNKLPVHIENSKRKMVCSRSGCVSRLLRTNFA